MTLCERVTRIRVAQEAEILLLVAVAIALKARKAVSTMEVVDKALMFSKAGLTVLMYYADAKLMAMYLVVFAGAHAGPFAVA